MALSVSIIRIGFLLMVFPLCIVTLADCSTLHDKNHSLVNEDACFTFLKEVFPEAVSYSAGDLPSQWITVLGRGNIPLGYAVFTSPYADTVHGYNGPITLLICIDINEIIRKVIILEHSETAELITFLQEHGFLDSWNDMHWRQAITQEVDTISGATISSDAIREALRQRLGMMNSPQKRNKAKSSLQNIFKNH